MGSKGGFTFANNIEHHKKPYQVMLALVKKKTYTAYDPSTNACHFLNGITDPLLGQAKLSLDAN